VQPAVQIPPPLALVAWSVWSMWRVMVLTLALVLAAVLVLDELVIRD
jgi:hypothetical protein